eukprot:GHVL01021314.1.p1 GENE.GHVL01021314.1~~GHVL01021314.1.p1  ORF type:complete len:319 (-),score=61.42 GHVL01021314.1:531-1487(-)
MTVSIDIFTNSLYLAVTASSSNIDICKYKLVIDFKKEDIYFPPIRRHSISINERIDGLRKDPQRLSELLSGNKEKDCKIIESNKKLSKILCPRGQWDLVRYRALRREYRQEETIRRKSDIVNHTILRKQMICDEKEERMNKRISLQLKLSMERQIKKRQKTWLTVLFIVPILQELIKKFQKVKFAHQEDRKRHKCATMIQSMYLRHLTWRRRQLVVENGTIIRTVLTVVVRQLYHASLHHGGLLCQNFLKHATSEGVCTSRPVMQRLFTQLKAGLLLVRKLEVEWPAKKARLEERTKRFIVQHRKHESDFLTETLGVV